MKVTIKVQQSKNIDEQLKRIHKAVQEASNLECAVGYPKGKSGLGTPEPAYDSKASIIEVAIWNNYGTKRMPARPFMDLARQLMEPKYYEAMEKLGPKILKGEADPRKVLDVIGLQCEQEVRNAIMEGDWAPNAPSTIAHKKSDRPLVDTGTMRNRVTHEVREHKNA